MRVACRLHLNFQYHAFEGGYCIQWFAANLRIRALEYHAVILFMGLYVARSMGLTPCAAVLFEAPCPVMT